MKITLRFISALGLIGYLLFIKLITWAAGSASSRIEIFYLIGPPLYLVCAIAATVAKTKTIFNVFLAAIAHLILLGFLISIWVRGGDFPMMWVGFAAMYGGVWWLMYANLPPSPKPAQTVA